MKPASASRIFFSGYNFISSLSGKLHSAVKFDISHKNGLYSAENGDTGESDETTFQKTPAKEWEIDVRPQVSSHKWLQNYGLRKARLHMDQILPSIGFKLSDGQLILNTNFCIFCFLYM